MSKPCSKCGEDKSFDAFHRHHKGPMGRAYWCKDCTRVYSRTYRERTRASRLDRIRSWQERNQDRVRASQRSWEARNREKKRAHKAVARALAAGDLERPELCGACGHGGLVEAHHEDYALPLDVRWLCKACHVVADQERRWQRYGD